MQNSFQGEFQMIKAGVIGATGYAGAALVYLLTKHADVEIVYLASHSYAGKLFSDIYPGMSDNFNIILEEVDMTIASNKCDVLFLALPPGISTTLIDENVIKNTVVIDLGADFRLKDRELYKTWYKKEAPSQKLLNEAVYSLADLDPCCMKDTNLISNPGCYTTCSILTLSPLVKYNLIESNSIIINAMSGTSGAGRSNKIANLFCEVNESVKAYGITTHRHTPEIEMALGELTDENVMIQFTPHLIPMNRGILSTCTAKLKKGVDKNMVDKAYANLYNEAQFVHLLKDGQYPETRFIKQTNRIDISYKIDDRTGNIICVGAIDNLIKGAAGQAVQNMNLRFGLNESLGLDDLASNT
jgi:N-acetyl-gamma-glutamyl-phosphate reductase